MDGEHGFRGVLTICQKHRDQCGLPVVTVHDVRPPGQAQLPERQHGTNSSEQMKPVSVVPPVFAFFVLIRAVASTVEQGWAIHKPEGNGGARQSGLPQGNIILAVAKPGFPAGSGLPRSLQRCRVAGEQDLTVVAQAAESLDRKSTRLNSSHVKISYAVFCLKK